MVEGPDLDTAVWVRCLGVRGARSRRGAEGLEEDDSDDEDGDGRVLVDGEDRSNDDAEHFGDVQVSCGWTAGERGHGEGEDTAAFSQASRSQRDGRGPPGERIARMRRGDIWLVRWSGVRDAVARGECELL